MYNTATKFTDFTCLYSSHGHSHQTSRYMVGHANNLTRKLSNDWQLSQALKTILMHSWLYYWTLLLLAVWEHGWEALVSSIIMFSIWDCVLQLGRFCLSSGCSTKFWTEWLGSGQRSLPCSLTILHFAGLLLCWLVSILQACYFVD